MRGFHFLLEIKTRAEQPCFLINFNHDKKNYTEEKLLNLVKTTEQYSHKI